MASSFLRTALRGAFITFRGNPFTDGQDALQYESDGLIICRDGLIEFAGPWDARHPLLAGATLRHYPDALMVPGFIDTHVHYPQMQMIGAYGAQLIDWLNTYTFVAEQQYSDLTYARTVADTFICELLRSGTTTAAVYCTVHPASVQAFFEAAEKRDLRMIAGKVLMDRNAPDALLDTAQSGYDDSLALINAWHGKGRLHYAITPRFAPTSTPAQLEAAGALWKGNPTTYMQTHLSENHDEIAWVKSLFPGRKGYLDVYDYYGLVGPRALYGHAIHVNASEWQRLAEADASVTHCPTSNLFLGSGLFDFARTCEPETGLLPVRTGLATDVGAGTSLSMLRSMGEAYKVGQLGGYSLSAIKAFYLATRGAANALHLEHRIGSIAAGHDADIVVLDRHSTPLLKFRDSYCNSIEEVMFVLMTLADDRAVKAVYINGAPASLA